MTAEPSFATAYRQDPQRAVQQASALLREAAPADGPPLITDEEADAVAQLGLAGAVLAGRLSPERLEELLRDPPSRWRLHRAVTPNGAATAPFVPGQGTNDWLGAGVQGLLGEIRGGTGPRPGAVISGRYELIAQVGQGGMGVVFKALDRKLSNLVAVKVVFPGAVGDGLTDLVEEARRAGSVSSDFVVRPLDHGVDGFAWFAMEYLDGPTLAERLHQQRPLGWDEARRAVTAVLQGLRVIHHAGLLHRDVKPGNVMSTREGLWKVVDFGLALPRPHVGSAAFAEPAGTLRYLAPECWEHPAPFTPRSDLYAVGVLLAELLATEPLFEPADQLTLWRMHRERDFAAAPGLPPAARPVVAKATAKDPAARYASADEFLAALASARAPSRRRLLWLAAALPLLAGGLWLLPRGRTEPVAYRGDLNVLVAPPDQPAPLRPLGIPGTVPVRVGWAVAIQARLAEGQRGHHYLLAIDSTGKAFRLHPGGWAAGRLPAGDPRQEDCRWPPADRGGKIQDVPPGLEVILWLVRDRPLTRDANAAIDELLGELKWRQPAERNPADFPVYWENGLRTHGRGPVASDGPTPDDPISQTEKLLLALKEAGLVQYSRAVCYPLDRP